MTSIRAMNTLPFLGFSGVKGNWAVCLVLLFLSASGSGKAFAQKHGSDDTIRLLRQNFEVQDTYADPIASVKIPCRASNWYSAMNWGDGTPGELLSHETQPKRNQNKVFYNLFSRHHYDMTGTYKATIKVSMNCVGRAPIVEDRNMIVNVYNHVALASLSTNTPVARAGSSVTFVLRLQAPAPPSGTRVLLSTSNPRGKLPPFAVPRFITITPGSLESTFRVPTLPTAQPGMLVVGARSTGALRTAEVELRR